MRGQLIQITKEDDRPKVVYPHCKKHILIDIRPFRKDVTKILQDKCPKCHGAIFVGVFIVAHSSLNNLLTCIRAIINTIGKPEGQIIK